MARMPREAPRSVPDPYGDQYDAMKRQWLAKMGGDFILPTDDVSLQDNDDFGEDPDFVLAPYPADADAPDDPSGAPSLGLQTNSGPSSRAASFSGLHLLPPSPGEFGFDGALLPTGQRSSAEKDSGRREVGAEPVSGALDCAPDKAAGAKIHFAPLRSIGHPGLAESFIPVWGSGREAIADLQEGDYLGAGLNGALAVADFIPGEAVLDSSLKGAWKFGGSHTWNATRKWMARRGYFEAYQPGHHWLIPQNGWGKNIPDFIKNQPWNIKVMRDPMTHGRIHGKYLKPRFNFLERLGYGTPSWAKAVAASAIGHPVMAARDGND